MKKILLVEDDQRFQDLYKEIFEGSAEILSALTVGQAREVFANNPDIAAIVMDFSVPGLESNTLALVREIRKSGFDRPIIADSNMPACCRLLCLAGCDYECDKASVPDFLRKLLGLNSKPC